MEVELNQNEVRSCIYSLLILMDTELLGQNQIGTENQTQYWYMLNLAHTTRESLEALFIVEVLTELCIWAEI